MSDFETDDKRGEWLRLLDAEADKLVQDGRVDRAEVEELREEGWVSGKRESVTRRPSP